MEVIKFTDYFRAVQALKELLQYAEHNQLRNFILAYEVDTEDEDSRKAVDYYMTFSGEDRMITLIGLAWKLMHEIANQLDQADE